VAGVTTKAAVPDMTIWVQPLGYVTAAGAPPLVVSDYFAGMAQESADAPGPGTPYWQPPTEIGGVVLQTPEIAVLDTGKLYNIKGLQFWQFTDPQTQAKVGGFTLEPKYVPWYTFVNNPKRDIALPDETYFISTWSVQSGQCWAQAQPDDDDQGYGAISYYDATSPDAPAPVGEGPGDWGGYASGICSPDDYREPWSGATFWAMSDLEAPTGQSFALKTWLGTPAAGGPAWVRLSWADDLWSIVLAQGKAPALYRKNPAVKRNTGDPKDCYWAAVASGESACDWFPSDTLIGVHCIAGRLIIKITCGDTTQQIVYTNTTQGYKPGKYPDADALIRGAVEAEPASLNDGTYGSGHIRFGGAWTPATWRLYEVLWGKSVSKTQTAKQGDADVTVKRWWAQASGQVSRQFYAARWGSGWKSLICGWSPDGEKRDQGRGATWNDKSLGSVDVTVAQGTGTYTLTLSGPTADMPMKYSAAADGGTNLLPLRGAKTPFVYGVILKSGGASLRQTQDGIDIKPALSRAVEEFNDPLITPGPTWTLELNREMLGACKTASGATVGAGWTNYVAQYHPAQIVVRTRYTDGSVGAEVQRFFGFIWRDSDHGEGAPNKRTLRLDLRDFTVRSQRPAGLVDGRFAPLEWVAGQNAMAYPGGIKGIYGSDAIRYMLETSLGPTIADAMEVYYDADPPTLLDWRTWTYDFPPSGFWFPPPYGEFVGDWIKKIADGDGGGPCVFFWAGSMKSTGKFVPIYGNYFAIVQNAPTHVLPDIDAAAIQPLQAADIDERPEYDFNRYLIWGKYPGMDAQTMPGLPMISAEARIESGSAIPEQNIDQTWERTKVSSGDMYMRPHIARVIAVNSMRMLRGVKVAHTSLKTRGIDNVCWGHKVTVTTASKGDPIVGQKLTGNTYRLMRGTQTYDYDNPKWTLDATVVPQPSLD
jgi:hypothetical protein